MPKSICNTHIMCYYDELTEGIATEWCPEEDLKPVALIKIQNRSFKTQVVITDAEYVYRDMDGKIQLGDSFDKPYFIYSIPEGEYVGIGRKKKQFNSSCYLHKEE